MKTRSSKYLANSVSKKSRELAGRKPSLFTRSGNSSIEALEARIAPAGADLFASATVIPGTSFTDSGSISGLSGEPGEPTPSGSSPLNSAWYQWTAPATGSVKIHTIGSTYDTTLGVFTGSSVSALTLITSNDDFHGLQSEVNFNAVAGTTYRIQVDGYSSNTGSYNFNFSFVPSETSVVLTGGNLLVTDENGGVSNDSITLILQGANLQITDPVNPVTAGPGMIQVNGNTVQVPLASITGNIQINTLGGNDSLTLNLGNGDFLPAGGLFYNGGNPTVAPGDRLTIIGGNQGAVIYNYTNANDGNIVMQNFGTVTYTGLEPITNTGTATDIVFNLPAGTNNATLSDDAGGSGNGLSRLNAATFELTDFANPTGSITINRGSANDTLMVNAAPDLKASLTVGSAVNPFSSVIFNGAVTLDPGKNLSVNTTGPITVAGGTLATTGIGTIDLTSGSNISFAAGTTLSAASGAVTLVANTAGTAGGNFVGIQVRGSITTGSGNISLTGTGGNSGASNFGIEIGGSGFSPGIISSTSGAVTLTGTGGAGNGGDNDGIILRGAFASSISGGGNISLTGTSGSTGPGSPNEALNLEPGSSVTSGSGNITFTTDNVFRLDAAINAGTNTVTLRQKTAGVSLGITNDFYTGISASQLAAITAGTIQIGDGNSGPIVVNAGISTPQHLSLTTGAGVSGTGGISLAAGKNLTITSNGAINLAGAVSVSGTTTLGAGSGNNITLTNPGNALATVTVNSGATVSLRDDGGFNLGGANVSTLLQVESAGAITQTGALTGTGGLTKLGTGTLTLSQLNPYTGATTINGGTLSVSADANLGTGNIAINNGTLAITGLTAFSSAKNIAFGAGMTGNIDVSNTVGATLSGSLSGGGGAGEVTKIGSGTLTLTGNSVLASGAHFAVRSGTVVIDGGSVTANGTYQNVGYHAGDNATLTIQNGGSFNTDSDFNIADRGGVGTVNIIGTTSQLNVGNLYVGKGLLAASTGTLNQYGGTVTAALRVEIGTTAGTAGTYNLDGGVLTTPFVVKGGGTGTFNFDGGTLRASRNEVNFMNGLTAVNIEDGGATINTNGFNVEIAQVLRHDATLGATLDGGLRKIGNGNLSLAAANTYTGGTDHEAGRLGIRNSAALGTGAVDVAAGAQLAFDATGLNVANNITLNGMTTYGSQNGALIGGVPSGPVFNTLSGTLTLNATSNISTVWDDKFINITGQITGPGGLVIDVSTPGNGPSQIILSNPTNNYAGGTTVNPGAVLRLGTSEVIPHGPTAGNVLNNSAIIIAGNFNETINGLSGNGAVIKAGGGGTSTLTIGGNNQTAAFSGSFSNPSGTLALTKIGTGTQILTGSSTFSGAVTVDGGTLQAGTDKDTIFAGALGSLLVTRTLTVNSGATLSLLGGDITAANQSVVLNGGTLTSSGFNHIGNVTLNGGHIVTGDGGQWDYQALSIGGNVLVTGSSASSITTTGSSSNGVHLGANTVFTVNDVVVGTDLLISAPLVNQNGNLNWQPGGFTKQGTGTMVLSAASGFTGTATVAAGTLLVDGSFTSSPNGIVVNGGMLGGAGTIARTVTVNTGGQITAGTDGTVGTLTVDALNFNGGTYRADLIGAAADRINVTGSVTLAQPAQGIFSLNNLASAVAEATVFRLIDKAGAVPIVNTPFTNAAEGGTIIVDGKTARYSYQGGTGNDFTITVDGNVVTTGTIGADVYELRRIVSGGVDLTQLLLGGSVVDSRPTAGVASWTIDAGDGADSLLVNYGGSGGFLNIPISFNGENPTGAPGDTITIGGATVDNVTHDFATGDGGSFTVIGGSNTRTITYTGTEAIIDNLAASDRTFNFSGASETITLSDAAGANSNRVTSTLGNNVTFTNLANASSTLSINGGDGGDTINVVSLDPAFNSRLAIAGNVGADSISISAGLPSLNALTTASETLAPLPALSIGAGGLSILAFSTVTQTGALSVAGLTSINANANAIDLSNAGNDFVGAVSLTNFGAANSITVTDVNSLLLGTISTAGTFTATAGGTLTQTGAAPALVAANAVLTAATGIDLRTTVTSLRATNTTSGDIVIRETNGLNLTGASTLGGNGNIDISNLNGGSISDSITVTGLVSAHGSGDITLRSRYGLTLGDVVSGNDVVSGSGNIALLADHTVNIENAQVTTGGDVTIDADFNNLANTGPITTGPAGLVSGNNLTLKAAGGIAVNTSVATVAATNIFSGDVVIIEQNGLAVNLISNPGRAITVDVAAGQMTDNNAGLNFNAATVSLRADGGIGISGANGALETSNGTSTLDLKAIATTGGIAIENSGPLRIIDTGAFNPDNAGFGARVTGASGGITINAGSPITIASNESAPGAISHTAAETNDPGVWADDITVNSGVSITSTGSSVTLQAGDDILLNGGVGLQISAATAVTLTAAFNDQDSAGAIVQNGAIQGGGLVTVTARDLITLGANVTSTGGNVTIQSSQNDIFQGASGVLVSGDVLTLAAGGSDGDISGSTSGYLATSANTITFTAPGTGEALIREVNGATLSGSAGTQALLYVEAGNAVIGGNISANLIAITAANGSIIDGNSTGTDLSAANAVLVAATGVGPAGAIETAIDRLEAQTTTGNIRISNVDALIIGGISLVNGVTTGTGDIIINSDALTIQEQISTANNVTLNAVGTITETGAGAINAADLVTNSIGGQTLNGANTIGRFVANNTASGNISLVNTAATLTVAQITNLAGSATVTNTGNVQLGDTVLNANVNVANVATIVAQGGAITDGNDGSAVNNITAVAAILVSGAGIGTSSNPIETTVANLEAEGGSGGVYITETDALTIGGATPALNGIRADGDISIQSGALTIAENIDTVSNVTLIANGTITETTGAVKNAALLTTTSNGGQQLGGANTVRAFTATNTGAGTNVLLTNNSLAGVNPGGLTVNDVTNLTGGTVTIANTGDVNVIGSVRSGSNPLPLGGDITITSTELLTVAPSGVVSSRGGSGGSLTLENQVLVLGSVVVGYGDVILTGGAGDLNINAPISVETPLNLRATGNINIRAKVETTLTTSDLTAFADTDYDAQGGIRIFPEGELKAGRDLTLTGSDYIGTPEIDSIIVDADAAGQQQLGAFGNIRLLNGGGAPVGAATHLSGYVNAITNGNVTFEHAVVLAGDNARVATHGAGNILFNGTLNGGFDLRLSTDVGLITFDEAVGSVASPIGDLLIDSALDVTAAAEFNAESVNMVLVSNVVSFVGPVTTGSTGGDFIVNATTLSLASTVNGGNGDIVWSVDNISISGDLSGLGTLTIQPLTLNRSIGINAAGDLNLSAAEIAHFQNGFAAIQIGSASGSGAITVGAVTFHDTVSILSPASGGSIAVNGAIEVDDYDDGVTLQAPTITFNVDDSGGSAIDTLGGDITLTGNVLLTANTQINAIGDGSDGDFTQNGTINGSYSLTIVTGSGDINFNGASNGASIGGSQPLASIDLSGGTLNLRPQIITTGSQLYTGDQINLLGGALRSTGAGSIVFDGAVELTQQISIITAGALGDNVTFNGDVDSASSGLGALKITAGTGGAVYFSGDVGASVPLASLNVASARLIQAGQSIFAQGALEFTADEINFFGGAGSIHGNSTIVLQPISRDIITVVGGTDELPAQLDLTATDVAALADGFSKITIGRDLGEAGLVVAPATAAGVTFSDPVVFEQSGRAGTITVLGSVHGIDNASLDFRTTTVVLDGVNGISITTVGQPVSFDATVIASDVTVNTGSGTGAITFRSTIQDYEGGNDLTLTAGAGDISIMKYVGTTKGATLGAIDITTSGLTRINGAVSAESFALNAGLPLMGTAEILAKSITTTGVAGQVFNADIQLNSTVRFNSNNGPVTFGGEIDSRLGKAYSALVSAGTGNVLFLGDVGSDVALGTLRAKTKGDVTFEGNATARGVQVVATTFTMQDVHGVLSQSYVGAGTFEGALTGAKLKIRATNSIISTADWNLTGRAILKASKNSIILTGANQFSELDVISADAEIHEAGDLLIRSANVTSTLTLVANGDITDGTRLRLGSLVATSLTGSITLDGVNRIASLGAVSAQTGVLILSGGTTLSLTDVISTESGNVIIVGNNNSRTNVVISGGSIQLGAGAGYFRVYSYDESISSLSALGAEYTEVLGNTFPYEPVGADADKNAVILVQA